MSIPFPPQQLHHRRPGRVVTLVLVATVAVAGVAGIAVGSGPETGGRPPTVPRAVATDGPGSAHGSLATNPAGPGAGPGPATASGTDDGSSDIGSSDDDTVEDITGQQSEMTSEEPPVATTGPALPELVGTVFDA